nr:hypothetical protein Iba_chr07cCG10730 [Ipomoea batatas]
MGNRECFDGNLRIKKCPQTLLLHVPVVLPLCEVLLGCAAAEEEFPPRGLASLGSGDGAADSGSSLALLNVLVLAGPVDPNWSSEQRDQALEWNENIALMNARLLVVIKFQYLSFNACKYATVVQDQCVLPTPPSRKSSNCFCSCEWWKQKKRKKRDDDAEAFLARGVPDLRERGAVAAFLAGVKEEKEAINVVKEIA